MNNIIHGGFGSTLGHIFYMNMQNGSKLEIWWQGFLIHASKLKICPLECLPCLYREAMRLQCFPPTQYIKWAWILCQNSWQPFTTWLCKALICSIIAVWQHACTCFFFCLVGGFIKKKTHSEVKSPIWVNHITLSARLKSLVNQRTDQSRYVVLCTMYIHIHCSVLGKHPVPSKHPVSYFDRVIGECPVPSKHPGTR